MSKPRQWYLRPVNVDRAYAHDNHGLSAFVFELSSLKQIPRGWVSLDAQIPCKAWDCKAELVWNTGSEPANENSFYPSMTLHGRIHDLVCLPGNIQQLRCVISAESAPAAITLTEIGLFSRLLRMCYRTIPAFFKYTRAKRIRAGVTLWLLLTDIGTAYAATSKLRARTPPPAYQQWLERFDTLTQRDRRLIVKHCKRFSATPQFSILLTLDESHRELVAATVESVRNQIYPHWELFIAMHPHCSVELKEIVATFSALDQRIKALTREVINPNNLCSLYKLCTERSGTFFGHIGANDLLSEHAFYCVAAELQMHPNAVVLYSDEDVIDNLGIRKKPNFKPDWNPQLLLSQNYLAGLCLYRSDVVQNSGSADHELTNDAAYALALGTTVNIDHHDIKHIPFLLYHRRDTERLSYDDLKAEKRTLINFLSRHNISGKVVPGSFPGSYRIHYALPALPPLISIIIPSRDKSDLLSRCIVSIRKISTYINYEIVIVDNQSSEPETLTYLEQLDQCKNVTILRYQQDFNYSAINNYAAGHCRGDVLILLNNDTEVITPNWMEEMLGLLHQPGVAIVGAKLFYADNSIQHAGDLVGVGGIANHAHAFLQRDDTGYQGRAMLAQDLSAVTGACLMVWKSDFRAMGGLNATELPVAFNDVDFCLRVRESGKRIVWTPWAELYHHESKSRGNDDTPEKKARRERENNYMRRTWGHKFGHDPAYNPNLSQERPDFSLSHAPIPPRPWLD